MRQTQNVASLIYTVEALKVALPGVLQNVTSVIKLKISKNEIRKLSIYSILTFSIGTTILPVAGPAVDNPASHTITCNNLNPILLELRAGFKPNNDKGGFDELPDSTKFLYNVDQGRGLKNQAKKVWRNPKAKKEILIILKKFDKDDRIIEEKSLKGFRDLTELKKSRSGP